MKSSPPAPTGSARRDSSSTYIRVFQIGRPMVITPEGAVSPGSIRNSVQPTVVSVGPYSLITVAPGCRCRHPSSASPIRDSPPSTNCSLGEKRSGSAVSRARWLGVALTKLGRSNPPAVGAWSSSSMSWTVPPLVSGAKRPVTVRSKETGEWTSARPATLP